jgi:RNA polymerase sigma factor (sigma-70 family)
MQTDTSYDPWDSVNERLDLRRALAALSAEERRLVALWLAGHTQQEMADALDVDQATVSRQLDAVLCQLRAKMTGDA